MASAVIGALRVVLGVDTAAFEGGLNQAQKELSKFGGKMKKLGGQVSGVGAALSVGLTAPIAALGAVSIKAATESKQALGQVEAALKSMGAASGKTSEDLQKSARALQGLSTFDDDEILQKVTANLLTFGKVSGEVFDRAQLAAVNMSARLGQDLQSSALQLGKALNDPIKGLTALGRVGVQFTADQKEQIKAMVAAGDTAGAQGVILGELERQFGGAAKAMQDATPGDDLKDAWADFTETIGAIAIKVLPPLTAALSGLLNAFNNLPAPVQGGIVVFGGLLAIVGPIVVGIGGMITAFGAIAAALPAIAPLVAGVTAGFSALLPILATVGRVLLGMLVSSGPIGWLILAIGAVVTIWANWDKIGPLVQKLYLAVKTWIQDKLGAVFTWLKGKLTAVGDYFKELWDRVVGHSYIPDLVEGVAEWMAKLDAGMVAPAKAATKATAEAFQTLRDDVASIMEGLLTDQERATRELGRQQSTLRQGLAKGIITQGEFKQANDRIDFKGAGVKTVDQNPAGFVSSADMVGGLGAALNGPSNDNMQQLQGLFASAFTAGIDGAVHGDLKDTMKSWLGSAADSAARNLGDMLSGALFGGGASAGGGGGLLSGLFGGGSSGGAGGLLGGLLGGKGGGMGGMLGGLMKFIPGFASGGGFTVQGRGGVDNNLAMMRLSNRERVTIETPGQQRAGGAGLNIGQMNFPGVRNERDARRSASVVAARLAQFQGLSARSGVG